MGSVRLRQFLNNYIIQQRGVGDENKKDEVHDKTVYGSDRNLCRFDFCDFYKINL